MVAPVLRVFFGAFAAGFELGAEFGDGGGEIVDASVFRGDGSNDRRMPAVSGHYQRKHSVNLLFEAIGALAIRFVEDEDVSDFHQAGFHILNVVAETGYENDDHAIGEANDVNFILANADGFDEDLMLACGVEKQRDFGGGASEAPKKSTSGHGANENAGVTSVALHADTIAEDCAAGVGTGGIYGDDTDAFVLLAVLGGDAIDQCAFSRAGCTGDSGEIGGTSLREKNFQQRLGLRGMIFNSSDSAGDGAGFSGADLLRPFLDGGEITIRRSLRGPSRQRHGAIISCPRADAQ